MIRRTFFPLAAALLLATGVASAALTPEQKCQIAKNNAAKGKYACLTSQDSKVIHGKTPNTAACETAFSKAFAKAEAAAAKAGGSCPVTGDAAAIEQRVDATQGGTAQFLAGEGRFHDNGDGTITDAETGLMWEKKSKDGSLHDVGNTYAWTDSGTAADGTLFTTFLAGLNAGSGFAMHTDWRIPTISELETIIDYTVIDPSVPAAFNSSCTGSCTVTTCSCTVFLAGNYWSSTSLASSPTSAWYVVFNGGGVTNTSKVFATFVRGVRAGS
jgi:hypothetical protein